ncbi:MAG: PadR family transcriptional regulator, partial [Desulfurococcales archaeon]|nr:PadR family transcriptional regulator [Desulfurococcales archaeon]
NRWRPSIGTIYRMLNEMVGEGLIEKQEITEGRRTIIYYRPTQEGISEFIKRSKLFLEKVHLGLSLLTATLQELKKAGMSDRELELKLRKVLEVLKKYF